MRGVTAKVLTAALLVLATSPAFAQPQPGQPGRFGFGMTGGAPSAAMLLRNEKVQEELKLTDDQKTAVQKAGETVNDKYKDDLAKARTDMDREKMADLRKTMGAELMKAVADVLKPDQTKRLKQIEVQAAGINAFTLDDVQAALKLTDAQKTAVKGAVDDMQKDVQDLFKDAQGDREKMTAAFKKIQDLRTDAVEQVVKGLTDDQKKTWTDLKGDKFELALGFPGAVGAGTFGPGRQGRGGVGRALESLKLTDDQKTKAQELVKASEEKTRALMTQAREDLLKQLKDVLPEDQFKQLKDELEKQNTAGPGNNPGGTRRNRNPNQ